MTKETRTLVSPQDIVGMGFTCPHCSAMFSVPVNKLDRVANNCPNCNQRWVKPPDHLSEEFPEEEVLKRFYGCLRLLQQREFGKLIRLEIKGEANQLLRVECPGCKSGRPDLIYHSSHCPVYKAAHQQQA
jgi:predicted Zn finger-like uncharacterized protein